MASWLDNSIANVEFVGGEPDDLWPTEEGKLESILTDVQVTAAVSLALRLQAVRRRSHPDATC